MYDDGGEVKAEPSIADRIKSRAVDLYNQGKALLYPLDNEAEALKQKQQNIDEGTAMRPYASTPVAAPTAAPTVKPDPAGAYGTRPGEERIDTSKMKPLGSAYDCGGMVEVYDDSGEVKAEPSIADRIKSRAVDLYNQGKALLSPMDNEAEALKPYASTPVAASIAAPAVKPYPAGAYGTRPGEERIDTSKTKPLGMTLNFPFHSAVGSAYDCGGMVEVYDDSGVVDTNKESDDPEKEAAYHQAAAEIHAEEAEKHKASANDNAVMNPNPKGIEAKLDTDLPEKEPGSVDTSIESAPSKTPMNMENAMPLAPVITESSNKVNLAPRSSEMRTLQGAPMPAEEQGTGTLEQRPPDDKMAIIAKDKEDAAKEGFAGLSKLGLAMIHENVFKPEYLKRPEEAAPAMPTMPTDVPGKVKDLALPQPQPTVEPRPQQIADRKLKLQDYDQRIQNARDLGTPEGDREAASLELAKMHYEKINPRFTGLGGKILHGLTAVGNIAGDIFAPATMANIPGTELHKQRQAAQYRAQEQEATKESLEAAQARIAGQKTPSEATFRELQTTVNPDTLPNRPLYDPKNPQGRFYTKPEALDRIQTPGKSESVTWARAAVQAGDYDNLEHALTAYDAQKAGMPHMTDKERHLQDYIKSTGGDPNDPLTRDRAVVAMAKRDVETKANAALPIQERLKVFQQGLDIEKQQLSASQNKALEYGKAAKDQEM